MITRKTYNVLLLGILLLAAILRLFHPFQIPFTYDEVTAIIRTHYPTLSEEIKQGVMLHDNHPAGVQLFIYYWTRLFGYGTLTLKLPFIICGLLAIYYTYKLGQSWFSSTTGLICAAYIATLQYTIMYSQEIRPYISGMFFAVAMVYYWNNVVFKPEGKLLRNSALYILFSALCAYDHHFCLLFAAIVGVTGLFFVKRNYILKYALAGILIFVLYIPHLHIFFYQLSRGGVGGPDGWLGAPNKTFILTYLKYIFHFSRSTAIVVIVLFLFGLISSFGKNLNNKKYFIISLAWFLIPLLTGYFYSVYVNPVLQYSVLIFSFPFLLFCIFGRIREMHFIPLTAILLVVCAVNVHSLIKGREHYNLFYQAPYERTVVINDSLMQDYGKHDYGCLIQSDDSDHNVTAYYIKQHLADTSFTFTDKLGCFISHPSNYCRLIDFMARQNKTYFGFGCTAQFDPIVLHIISNYYPFLVKKWDFAGGNFYLLSKHYDENMPALYTFQSVNDFEKNHDNWDKADPTFITDSVYSSPHHSYKMDSLHEWGPVFSAPLASVAFNKNDIIEISLNVYPCEKPDNVLLVSALELNGKATEWRATPLSSSIPDNSVKTWLKVYHTLKLQDLKTNQPGLLLKVYLWNKGKKNFYMDDFSVRTVKGNPYIYGLFEKI